MLDQSTDTITITKERYYELRCAEAKVDLLEGGGVDNWEGYIPALYDYAEPDLDAQRKQIRKEIFGEEASP